MKVRGEYDRGKRERRGREGKGLKRKVGERLLGSGGKEIKSEGVRE